MLSNNLNNTSDNEMIYLINILNVHSIIKDGSVIGTSFIKEAEKRNIKLDSSCLYRKCTITQNEINFILYNKICQYVTIPYSIIDKNLEYKINKFTFYSFEKLLDLYDKYIDHYDIAFSAQIIKKGKMIYLSCLKGTDKFFLRTETMKLVVQNLNKSNVKLHFSNINYMSYIDVLKTIVRNKFN
jgi:hypothetical protein